MTDDIVIQLQKKIQMLREKIEELQRTEKKTGVAGDTSFSAEIIVKKFDKDGNMVEERRVKQDG